MGQPGRKPKPGPREPNGRIQRVTTQDALNDINERAARKVKAVVLAQPHRRDMPDPESRLCESALGRFCERRFAKNKELKDRYVAAGEGYADLTRRWRAAMAVPINLAIGEGSGGNGPSAATVRAWRRILDQIEAALWQIKPRPAFQIIRLLCLDDVDLLEMHEPIAEAGLQCLVYAAWQDGPMRSEDSDASPMRMRSLAGM